MTESSQKCCLACDANEVVEFLDLGRTGLANNFVASEALSQPDPLFSLRLGFCKKCAMVQLLELAPPAEMFSHYLYMSSVSSTLRQHLANLANTLVDRWNLSDKDLVVDVGSNDGTLLSCFQARGPQILGVDPARNLAALARKKGVTVKNAFFNSTTAREIAKEYGKVRLLTATNVYQHIPNQSDFLKGLDLVLEEKGTFVFESHYLQDLLDQCAFDTVYHEHVFFFSLTSIGRLLEQNGFMVTDVTRLPIHHGQIRVTVHRKSATVPVETSVTKLLDEERARGLLDKKIYFQFAEQVKECRKQLNATLKGLKDSGKTVVGYGAPAKAVTLLSFCEITQKEIPYIVDLNPLKQGRFTPGHRIPIVGVDELRKNRPDYLILLAWNFADEIMNQLSWFREAGGKFIIPVPVPRIV
jgi:2-polyprenyl-3-methyl-5-hydroxy-6-metoxy-1,4-benzoquinol methylase